MICVREGKTADLATCVEIAKEAFSGYVMFRPYEERAADGAVFYDSFVRSWAGGNADAGVSLIAECGGVPAGAVLLLPPDAPEVEVIDPETEDGRRAIRAAGEENYRNFTNFCIRAEEACHNYPEPAWYISMLAVRPAYQKKGVGHALLRAAEAFVKNQGGDVLTLCTSSAPNRAYYAKYGFEEFNEVMIPTGCGGQLASWSFRKTVNADAAGRRQ